MKLCFVTRTRKSKKYVSIDFVCTSGFIYVYVIASLIT